MKWRRSFYRRLAAAEKNHLMGQSFRAKGIDADGGCQGRRDEEGGTQGITRRLRRFLMVKNANLNRAWLPAPASVQVQNPR